MLALLQTCLVGFHKVLGAIDFRTDLFGVHDRSGMNGSNRAECKPNTSLLSLALFLADVTE
jgi:hypothetical protein